MIESLVVIIIYLATTTIIGLVASKKTKTVKTFQGAGMGVTAIVFASAGEWLGGTATSGISEYGFTYGISGAWYTIANGLGVLVLALLFAKLYRRLNRKTIPGIIAYYFGDKAQAISGIILVFVMLAVGLSQMIAAGKLGQALLGIDFRISVTIFAIIFIIFTMAGGMQAVTATNVLHLMVMYIGALLAVIFCVVKQGGISGFISTVDQVDASLLNPFSIGETKISSWIIASLLGACTAQAGIQPVLASKDEPTAKKACLYTALMVAPFGILTALLGIAARIMSEQGTLLNINGEIVTEAKLALPTLMMNLPVGLGGLVMAAVLAAILSTVAPITLAAGTMLTADLYEPRRPNMTEKQSFLVSRIATALSGVVCWGGSILLVNQTTVLDMVYAAYSLRGALFIVILIGIYGKLRNEKAACISMVLTGVATVVWASIKIYSGHYLLFPWLTETYMAVLTAFLSMVILSLTMKSKRM